MNCRVFFSIILSLQVLAANGQTASQQILSVIEEHSPQLQALRYKCLAELEESRQETVLDDPEVSFGYLWGDPGAIGNRWDLSVSQHFDFPTTYLHRKKVRQLANESAQLQYEAAKRDVMLQAKQLCIELSYNDSLYKLLAEQYRLSEQLLSCEKVRLSEGATTIMAYNLAQQQYVESKSEMNRVWVQMGVQKRDLEGMVPADVQLPLESLTMESLPLPAERGITSFHEWWTTVEEKSPLMCYVRNEVERASAQLQVSKDGWLPGFSVGYMSENTRDETFRGVTFSLTIPAWNNRHRVKSSELRKVAAEEEQISQKQLFMARMEGLFTRALCQMQQTADLRQMIAEQQTKQLLQRQFEEGAINLSDYLTGVIGQLELQKSLLSAERDAELMWVELHSVE